jgi:glutamyl-tRNA synthetase
LIPLIEAEESFTADSLDASIESLAESQGFKKFEYFPVARFAVSGAGGGPDLLPMISTLGRHRVLERFQNFLEIHATSTS